MRLTLSLIFIFLLLSHPNISHGAQKKQRWEYELIQMMNSISNPKDTIRDTLRTLAQDTVLEKRKAIFLNQGSIDFLKADTSLIRQTDTTDNLTFIQNLLQQDTLHILNDTLYAPLKNILWYYQHPPLDSSVAFVKNYLLKDSVKRKIQDSTLRVITDSLNNGIKHLIKKTQKAPTLINLINTKNDTIKLTLARVPQTSRKRLVLYDERDIPAGIWIETIDQRAVSFELDENTLIHMLKTQDNIIKNIPNIRFPTELKDYQELHMIFPEWDIGGMAKLNFNQAYLSNWIQGGESNLNSLLNIKFNIDYKKGKTIWNNDIEYKYGLIQSGKLNKLLKNEDRLEINSKYGTNAANDWYYSALINFKTQFFKGYDYPNDSVAVSGFLAPAYTVFSLGMDYKPSDKLTILISPISSKFTFMRDTASFMESKFGLNKNQSLKKELGAYVKSIFTFDLRKNIHIQNKINLFTNYIKEPQNIDIDWEVTVDMNITDYINTTISTHLIYDNDVDIPVYKRVDGEKKQVGVTRKIQFKEMLSVGISYKF